MNTNDTEEEEKELEFLYDDDFLEFLVEWSDIIATPKRGSDTSACIIDPHKLSDNYSESKVRDCLSPKRKLDALSTDTISEKVQTDIDAELVKMPLGANKCLISTVISSIIINLFDVPYVVSFFILYNHYYRQYIFTVLYITFILYLCIFPSPNLSSSFVI
jgi:hypothetical protein